MVQKIRTTDLNALSSFCEAARLSSVTAAAAALGIAKSAVSRHIRLLEQQFQVRLFERSARKLRLTRTGERLAEKASSILQEAAFLQEIAEEERSTPVGTVRITSTPEFGALLALNFLPELAERYPGLRFTMLTTYDFEDLQDPSFDVAFRIGSVSDDRLVAWKLGEFRRILVASAAFLERHPVAKPDDLEKASCLLFRVETANPRWNLVHASDAAQSVSATVGGALTIRNFSTLLRLAEADRGIAFVPDFLAKDAIDQGKIQRCLPEYASPPVSVYLSYRPGAQKITRLRAFIEEARNHVPLIIGRHSAI